jgi:hypothetical protein
MRPVLLFLCAGFLLFSCAQKPASPNDNVKISTGVGLAMVIHIPGIELELLCLNS